MKFGMFLPQGWRLDLVGIAPENQWSTIVDLARRADYGPWDSVWVYDHFHTVPVATQEATHEAWTLMAALAASTHNVKLGQMCTCMGYRNPAYLAKVAATVDIISGGRAQMGIGAGWYEHEWRAYGYGFPPVGDRISQLFEGVDIMHQAWTTGSATLDGKFYSVDGAIVQPRPLQSGGIPLWIAGGGEKRTLKLAARYAQYTNFSSDPEEFAHKSKVLEGHCRDEGTDYGAITRSTNLNVVLGRTDAEVRGRVATLRARVEHALPESERGQVETMFQDKTIGTIDAVIERLLALRDLGLGYAIIYFPEIAYDPTSMTLFEREVIPALR